MEVIDSCDVYSYYTIALKNSKNWCRFYLRYNLLLIYTYDTEGYLSDVLYFTYHDQNYFDFVPVHSQRIRSILSQMKDFGYRIKQLYSLPPYDRDNHLFIKQDLTLPADGTHELYKRDFRLYKMRAFAVEKQHECLIHFNHGSVDGYEILTPEYLKPVEEGFEKKLTIRCPTSVEMANHRHGTPLFSTKPCFVRGCLCKGLGVVAFCLTCKTFLHMCPYGVNCQKVFKISYTNVTNPTKRCIFNKSFVAHFQKTHGEWNPEEQKVCGRPIDSNYLPLDSGLLTGLENALVETNFVEIFVNTLEKKGLKDTVTEKS